MAQFWEWDARNRTSFDEIVAFSEVAQFIDTPVKHFSSGMYLRLAFAVAAHLRPKSCWWTRCWLLETIGFRKNVLGK